MLRCSGPTIRKNGCLGETPGLEGREISLTHALEVHGVEPIRLPFCELAVRHFEPGDLYSEIGRVDDL